MPLVIPIASESAVAEAPPVTQPAHVPEGYSEFIFNNNKNIIKYSDFFLKKNQKRGQREYSLSHEGDTKGDIPSGRLLSGVCLFFSETMKSSWRDLARRRSKRICVQLPRRLHSSSTPPTLLSPCPVRVRMRVVCVFVCLCIVVL